MLGGDAHAARPGRLGGSGPNRPVDTPIHPESIGLFKSFFPHPRLFFLSFLVLAALAVIVWYGVGAELGAVLGVAPTPRSGLSTRRTRGSAGRYSGPR